MASSLRPPEGSPLRLRADLFGIISRAWSETMDAPAGSKVLRFMGRAADTMAARIITPEGQPEAHHAAAVAACVNWNVEALAFHIYAYIEQEGYIDLGIHDRPRDGGGLEHLAQFLAARGVTAPPPPSTLGPE